MLGNHDTKSVGKFCRQTNRQTATLLIYIDYKFWGLLHYSEKAHGNGSFLNEFSQDKEYIGVHTTYFTEYFITLTNALAKSSGAVLKLNDINTLTVDFILMRIY